MIEIKKVIEIALKAGEEILNVYNSDDFDIQTKTDKSPLTRADTTSHNLIKKSLSELEPDIPVLSEEGVSIPYEERKNWKRFWLVDPLDGTKEFIKKNGEFTVNIALIENNQPVMGIIYAPAFQNDSSNNEIHNSNGFDLSGVEVNKGSLYFAHKNFGAYKIFNSNVPIKLPLANHKKDNLVGVRSRSHSSEEELRVLNDLGVSDYIYVGSSLKFCMIAEGLAQVYYRHRPTNEWDVGAGYAIAKYAGADISGLSFNKQNLLNDSFIVKNLN